MNWTFYLDALQIDEPIGFSDLSLRAKRDEIWHGVFFEASTADLSFYGEAADYLKEKKAQQGFAAEVEFRAVTDCGGQDEVYAGKLDFRKYKESCGTECLVTIPVEQEGCTMTLRNRYDQKVDTQNRVAFDGSTVLPAYGAMNFQMEVPARESLASIEGYVEGQFDVETEIPILPPGNSSIAIRPSYDRELNNSITNGNLFSFNNVLRQPIDEPDLPLTPQLLLDDEIACFDGDFIYDAIFKGSLTFNAEVLGVNIAHIKAKIVTWDAVGDFFSDSTLVAESDIAINTPLFVGTPVLINIDKTLSGSTAIASGLGLYGYIEIVIEPAPSGSSVLIDGYFTDQTYFKISANRSCPPTQANVSMIHELASFVTEAITDRCLKVKSDYYGRTDSEPYAAAEDGCGSLRVLASGLQLRRAENEKHFISLRELFDGLNAIDNIGMGIDGDWLRIEPAEFFYNNTKIMDMPAVPKSAISLDDSMAYSLIKVGYKNWESEEALGLDEFNSNKEFRTTLKSINNTLDITSNFIAGGYAIEITRRQSFASSGKADTKYDNNTFIICVVRSGGYAYTNAYTVEQGNIENAANFYSPATAYNWRIRPIYNLMRWWKSIAQSYINLTNSSSKLLFGSGTGNLLAKGSLTTGDPCHVDATLKAESDSIAKTDIFAGDTPIWKAETMNFVYPMSLVDYNLIKANPNGYLNIQCGSNGSYQKGYITNLLYRIGRGEADITVKLKWDGIYNYYP